MGRCYLPCIVLQTVMQLNRKTFFILSCITLFGFSLIGAAIIWFFSATPIIELLTRTPLYWQLLFGTGYGVAFALIAISVVQSEELEGVTDYFSQIIQNSNLRLIDVLFASLCAGIGEEIMFRGAIQPFLGIWITAIIFIAIHGYLSLEDLGVFFYGVLMVIMSAGLGYLTNWIGIAAAMSGHAAFDVLMFWHLLYHTQPET